MRLGPRLLFVALALAGPACNRAVLAPASPPPAPRCVEPGGSLVVSAAQGVLADDASGTWTVVGHGQPAHGAVTVAPDGSFTYTPVAGYRGQDTFTYTTTDAIQLYRAPRRTIAAVAGVEVDGNAFGSAWTPVPGASREFYGLTDRGPNIDAAADGAKIFAVPDFTPAIGRFALERGALRLVATIPLTDASGRPHTGLVPPAGAGGTNEGSFAPDGKPLAPDPRGLDSEGLAALADGSFWVADEYGPVLTHFAADGRAIETLTPFAANARGHRLPQVLARRAANRGLEGLTVTPDGKALVGIMQSALANDIGEGEAKKTAPVRIVHIDLATGATSQYLYLLDDPAELGTVVSEIAALSSSEFLVLERDGKFPGVTPTFKRIYRVSLANASDVGVATQPSDTIDPARGLLFGGTTTIEALTKKSSTSAARAALARHYITPVEKTLALDVAALLHELDPSGRLYPHDKLEGLAVQGGGDRFVLANDSDFGVDSAAGALAPKTIPSTGETDYTEVLVVDRRKLPARTLTTSVPVHVGLCAPSAPASVAAPVITPVAPPSDSSAEGRTRAALQQIERLNPSLRAVIAVDPTALDEARALDRSPAPRGPLWGMPILLKDNIEAKGPLPTTAGSLALADNVTGRDAPLVARLRAAGVVIVGKANLSEWANIRSSSAISGWSALGGQARNAHALNRSGCGSSTGSGVAVAAGMVPAAIGTETDGSITCPAASSGIVGFKPTVGLVSRTHVIPISHSQDTPGPMTRTVHDAAQILGIIAGTDPLDPATREADAHKVDYVAALSPTALRGQRIGVMRFASGFGTDAVFAEALATLQAQGAVLVEIPRFDGRDRLGPDEWIVLLTELRVNLNAYLAGTPPTVKTRTLADLIAFNRANAGRELALFGQELFEQAEQTRGLADPAYKRARAASLRAAGKDGIDRLLAAHKLVALVGPTMPPAWIIDAVSGDHVTGAGAGDLAAIAGYPHLTVPMGHVKGLPVGLSFIGPKWSDALILALGHAYETAAQKRVTPRFLPAIEESPEIAPFLAPPA
jgi:amidase